MQIVDRPEIAPGCCILSLKSEDPRGFFDLGITPALVDPRIYASVSMVEQLARVDLGMVDGGVVEELERLVADLRAQLSEADAELSAINFIKGRGYQQVKRAGRPPAQKAA